MTGEKSQKSQAYACAREAWINLRILARGNWKGAHPVA